MKRRDRRKILWAAGALLVLLITAGVVHAAGEVLDRYAIGSGGGRVESDGLVLHSSIGPPVAGAVGNGSLTLTSGAVLGPAAGDAPGQPGAEHLVEVRNNFFAPESITIDVGDTVTWQRIEGFHSVTADDGSFEQPAGDSWSTFQHTFTALGTYTYRCTVHPGMTGTVVVGDPPSSDEEAIYLPYVRSQNAQTRRGGTAPAGDDVLYLPVVRDQ